MNFYLVHERDEDYSADCLFVETPVGIFWKYSGEENEYWNRSIYSNVDVLLKTEQERWRVTIIPWSESTENMKYDVYELLLS